MKSRFSALFDGEVTPGEADSMLSILRSHAEVRQSFHLYGMIGEALRDDRPAVADITDRVMASLQQESELPPVRPANRRWQRPLLAVTASVAGVGIVAAVALLPQQRDDERTTLASAVQKALPAAVESGLAANDLQEYLIAHQAHSAEGYFGGSQQQIRAVSLVERGGR